MSSSAPTKNSPGKSPPSSALDEETRADAADANATAATDMAAVVHDDGNRNAVDAVIKVATFEKMELEQIWADAVEKDLRELAEEAMNNIGVRREGGPIGEGDYLYKILGPLGYILMKKGRVLSYSMAGDFYCRYADALDAIQERIDKCESDDDAVKAQLQADYKKVYGNAVRAMMSLIPSSE